MNKKGYLGLGRLISIILAIIPVSNIVLGILIRIEKGKIILAILNFVIFPLFYIVDLISMLLNNKLKYLI